MIQSVLLANALSIPSADWQALTQGQMIAAMPSCFLSMGQSFVLHQEGEETSYAQFWARCEFCRSVDSLESLPTLSRFTIWSKQALENSFHQKGFLFLACLRVYKLPHPVEVITSTKGEFLPLVEPIMVSVFLPTLTDDIFDHKKQKLEVLQPLPYPELEELHDVITEYAVSNPTAHKLRYALQAFLNYECSSLEKLDPDLAWIRTIANVGNSSNGYAFEKLVRRGLTKLGFSGSNLNPEATGGAGGMDFYCESPYPIVGECKATKTETVSDGTPAQLLKIGKNHLGKDQYERSVKLIVAAGELNFYARRTASEHEMNVIRPETLQRLVELKSRYEGSINLYDLKFCLEGAPFGEDADTKVNQYIDEIWKEIKVRLHIIEVVKKSQKIVGIEYICGVYDNSKPPKNLSSEELYNILIELSSPLTGYLGRAKGNDGSDRFYYLRDLIVE